MRRLTLALDALPTLRETGSSDVDLSAAATLAELAGVDTLRLGVNADFKPVREEDVLEARRAARSLELRMPPVSAMVRAALEVRPDRVLLAAPERDVRSAASPLDLRAHAAALSATMRGLADGGIPVSLLVTPELESVKAAHGEGVQAVEFFTGTLVDLPARERGAALAGLGEAVRLAAKLRMAVSVGGGLGYRSVGELLAAAPAIEAVTVGRAALARAVLVGLDRALRDLRSLVA